MGHTASSPVFSHETRSEGIRELRAKTEVYDAVVIGGGIVGAGLLRELAIRSLKCCLVEKADFASGTSSRSSKLIHGGLRYLEMFDFHLVFEALAERHWLLSTHPHLVGPLEFNLPLYAKEAAPPGARSSSLLGMGLWLYDALSLFRTPFFHGKHSASELGGLFPGLKTQGLKGSYYYADAMMLDDEVVLEAIFDAHRRGARALNYVKAQNVSERGADGLYTVTLVDEDPRRRQDAAHASAHAFTVKAREVIACVGPWTEKFGSHVPGGPERKLKPSKGVHIIVPWRHFPIQRCLVMNHPDGRIIFAIPRTDLGPGAEHVIIGTTDSPEHGSLESLHATETDIRYILDVLKTYFPQSGLTERDIVMTYAGVRPLLDSGETSEAKTSREHEIWRNKAGIIFMAGGKYTTFRKISQEIADFAFPRSGNKETEQESKALLSNPSEHQARFRGNKLWGKFSDEWVRWKLLHHAPCSLEDIVFRRLPIWMAGEDLVSSKLDELIEISQPFFNWTDVERASEVRRVKQGLALAMRWKS